MFGSVFGKKDLATEGPTTLVIKSRDIDIHKFSESHVITMRDKFPGLNDDVLARYLIARNNDVVKACEQLERALTWKALHCPVMKSSCLKEISSGKLYVRGFDKDGRPLLIYRSVKSFPADRDLEECGRMLVWFAEHVQRRMPPHFSKYTLLIDRVGHKSENTDQELMKHMSNSFQVNFSITFCDVCLKVTHAESSFMHLFVFWRVFSAGPVPGDRFAHHRVPR